MPNTPAQFPNFDLPGAEWFGLSPNANISIQGRRRKFINGPLTSVPANSQSNLQVDGIIESGFTNSAGIYVHHTALILGLLGFGVQATGLIIGFGLGAVFPQVEYIIGYPFLSPVLPSVSQAIFSDRDFLVTARDITGLGVGVNTGNLDIGAMLGVTNTAAGAIQANVGIQIVYTRLDGFTE